MNILVCSIEAQQYGFELKMIDSVVLAVETISLPDAPDHFLGAINIHGQITPVLNMRNLLGWPEKELSIKDQFIVCHIHEKQVALWIDNVQQVKYYKKEELIPAEKVFPNLRGLQYVLKENSHMIFLYNLEELIPPDSITILKKS